MRAWACTRPLRASLIPEVAGALLNNPHVYLIDVSRITEGEYHYARPSHLMAARRDPNA